jgi:electron transport complex protein RnfA
MSKIMIEFTNLFEMIIAAVFVSNIILSFYLGIDHQLFIEKKHTMINKRVLVILIVLPLSSMISFVIQQSLLIEIDAWGEIVRDLTYFRTITFIVVIILVNYLILGLLSKFFSNQFKNLQNDFKGVLPSTIVLGSVIVITSSVTTLLESLLLSIVVVFGYAFVLNILKFIENQLEMKVVPKSFQGLPLQLIILSIMALIFSGFGG